MDKNCNFYKAIEESIIRPQSEKMKSLDNEEHKFSEEYNKKIVEISAVACKKRNQKKNGGTKKKISVRTFAVIVAAAVLAGAVTATANESFRRMIRKVFTGGEDKATFSSQTESTDTPVLAVPSITAPVITDIPAVPVTTVLPAVSTTVTTVTSVTALSTVSGEDHLLTSMTEAATNPVRTGLGINLHQQPSMMAPSYPTVVSTAPQGAENPQTTTVISNITGDISITSPATSRLTESVVLPGSPIGTQVTVNTSVVVVTTIMEVEVTSIATEQPVTTIPLHSVTDAPSESESSTETEAAESTEETQEPTSDTTYTTTIKLK